MMTINLLKNLSETSKPLTSAEKSARWRKENPEKSRESSRKWRKNNPEKARQVKKSWEARNPEKRNAYLKNWRRKNAKRSKDVTNLWRASNPEKARQYMLKYQYDMDHADYERMLLAQEGACGICRVASTERLAVDHDHLTGEVRGLLCRRCNCGLGLLNDSIDILKSAMTYLSRPNNDIARLATSFNF